MAHERLKPQYHFDADKIAQLQQIAPECFEDGKIKLTTLRRRYRTGTLWPFLAR
jgi:adenine-specific DNA-methyltransferase